MDAPRYPYYKRYSWPPVDYFDYLGIWTFGKGVQSLERRMQSYGRESERPPLSPKSKLVHIALEEAPVSPTTVLDREPMHGMEEGEGLEYSDNPQEGMLRIKVAAQEKHMTDRIEKEDSSLEHGGDCDAKSTDSSPFSHCYSCGTACTDPAAHPPPGESSHWFLDIHDGVRRKQAFLFCWRCVDVLLRQLRQPPHPGCGHLPSLPVPSCFEECQLMFCGRCRAEIGHRL